MSRNAIAIVASIVAAAVAALVTWAVSADTVERAGLPAVVWCVIAAFAINWIAFVPSWIGKTEKYFDLTGSLTYISVTVLALLLGARNEPTSWLLAILIFIWAGRLGSFLFRRIRNDGGEDTRFNKIRVNPLRLFET